MKNLAITIGDINGIGPEIILKSLPFFAARNDVRFTLVGPKSVYFKWHQLLVECNVMTQTVDALFKKCDFVEPVLDCEPEIEIGKPTMHSGEIAAKCIIESVTLFKQNRVDAIVTAPISKYAIHKAGFEFPGHTEFLAELSGGHTPVMLLMAGDFRVAVATTHLPIQKVTSALSKELIVEIATVLNHELKHRFRIDSPKIAVTGLNPHAGESGKIGQEEIEIIEPAIAVLKKSGVGVQGPFPADAFFSREIHQPKFDAYLAMYHDQGMIPIKIKSQNNGVNYTCGLPFVRTSPDHGTAFDIAGCGIANEQSFLVALRIAGEMGSKKARS